MPNVRNKTVRISRRRKKVIRRRELSDEEKLRAIRALYIVTYNDSRSIIPLAVELWHLLGDVLEGTPLSELNLRVINREDFFCAYGEISPTETKSNLKKE